MRHRKISRRFGRTSSHRKAMFQNMMNSMIEHGVIKTTLPKAKDFRRYIEPMITLAKAGDTVAQRRLVFSRLRNANAVKKLFEDIAIRFKSRSGGYVRILKCGNRKGDCAPMAIIEFVDREVK